MTDSEILDHVVGKIAIKDMTAITFMHFISAKVNGLTAYTANTQELVRAVSAPPLGNKLPPEEKIRLVRKLLELDVKI